MEYDMDLIQHIPYLNIISHCAAGRISTATHDVHVTL